ncbi:hypothetical protein HPB47_015171 [Ixodes persulcatus]|uniref:Uncharacterized protein n=1 Tax=Ixodes persulcatus TaxID=34615 RepID=A0AC60QXR7_IXOPE|nr:hypothetical protein HPB47_015171 [Ixodes persulcatus]
MFVCKVGVFDSKTTQKYFMAWDSQRPRPTSDRILRLRLGTAAPNETSTWLKRTRKVSGAANGTGPDRLRQRALPDFQSPLLLKQGAQALAVAMERPRAKVVWQLEILNSPTPVIKDKEHR